MKNRQSEVRGRRAEGRGSATGLGHPASALRFHAFWGAAVLVLAVIVVYLPVLRAGFIWDDEVSLTSNPLMQSWAGLRDIWFSTKPYDYFPLTFTTFWIEWRLWGMNATGYHVGNVLLHATGAVLLWRVLLRLHIPGAWLAAMVFAVHPVCVASVAWVSERKNTLSLVFFLLSILWYSRFDSASRITHYASRHFPFSILHPPSSFYVLSLLAFLLALLSKTSVVMLPFVLWFCVWWRRTRNDQDEHPTPNTQHPTSNHAPAAVTSRITRHALRNTLNDLVCLMPFFALAFILGLVTVWFQTHRAISGQEFERDPLGVRLLGGSWALWFYLWKALWPVNLSMVYPRWEISPASLVAYAPGLFWMGLMFFCWRFRRGWGGAPWFGLGCFSLLLLPVLGFFDMSFLIYSRVADHWQYLALIGVIAFVVGGSAGLVKRLAGGKAGKWKSGQRGKGAEGKRSGTGHALIPRFALPPLVGVVAGVIVVALLATLTWRQAGLYRTEEILWRDTIEKNPMAWVAYNNLGLAVTDLEEKMGHYREALRFRPDYAPAHNNLGCAFLDQGKFAEAEAQLREAIKFYPGFAAAYNNLGRACLRQGQPARAREEFETALRLNSNQPDVLLNLGGVLFNEGKFEEAADRYRAALALKQDYVAAHYNLGLTLVALGRTNEAIRSFSAALRLQPSHAGARQQLNALTGSGGR